MMKLFQLVQFGLEHLISEVAPAPEVGTGEVRIQMKALSLNYRDLLIALGEYNPRLELPLVPISDGAGIISALGDGVTSVTVGQPVVIHGVPGWIEGPFQFAYHKTVLGCACPGLAAQEVTLPETALLPMPEKFDFVQAATLPTAGLTAWNSLVKDGDIREGQTVLTLGTGGVSIFVLQLAKALGAKVIVTSSSDTKLEFVRRMGADYGINYRKEPRWDRAVVEFTAGKGADLTIETGGAGTLERSMRATRAGGVILLIGSLGGLKAELDLRLILMKRLKIHGIYTGSRSDFVKFNRFLYSHPIEPEIDRVFRFEDLPEALRYMKSAQHIGKIAIEF